MGAIRLAIADDHAIFREGIALILSSEPDMEIVGQGASAHEALSIVRERAPDIILLDLDMPGGGLPAAADISVSAPATQVVILTVSAEAEQLREARQAGVRGYILKGVTARELVRIIRSIWSGAHYWPPALSGQL